MNNNNNNLLEEIIGEKVNQLNNKLEECNKNQNYKEFNQYKDLIAKSKEIGNKICNLMQERDEAVKKEDYDKAIELKSYIDTLKLQIYNLGEKRNSSVKNINSINNNTKYSSNNLNKENDSNIDSKNITQNNSYYLSNNNSKSFDSFNNNQINSNSFNNTKTQISQTKTIDYKLYDEMIIPTLRNKKLNPNKSQEEIDLENEALYTIKIGPLEILEKEQIETYSLLLPFIGEIGLQKLFSEQIPYKLEGITILTSELCKIFVSPNLNLIFIDLIELVSKLLDGKNNSSMLETFKLINQIFQYVKVNRDKIDIDQNLINNRILQKIINFFSVEIEIIRKKAVELYKDIIYLNVLDFKLLINTLISEDIKKKNDSKNSLSTIAILCKLDILKMILKNYSKEITDGLVTKKTFPKKLIIDYLIMNMNSSKNNIKDKCIENIKIASQYFGIEIFKGKLDEKQFEKLTKKDEPYLMNSSNTNKNYLNDEFNNIKIENECSLCMQKIGVEKMENHMKNCPMCCRCRRCKKFVEVKNLTNHRIYDCKYKNDYILCVMCKEAIDKKSYKKHFESKKCNPWKSNFERCPLCHVDIPSTDKGFFQHLMVDGCPIRAQINNTTQQGF